MGEKGHFKGREEVSVGGRAIVVVGALLQTSYARNLECYCGEILSWLVIAGRHAAVPVFLFRFRPVGRNGRNFVTEI